VKERIMKKLLIALLAALLVFTTYPANAEGMRVDEVAAFKDKYDPQFDAVLVKFTAAKKKVSF
jgi:hypothetical protein